MGKMIYFKPNGNWKSDGARFAAYFFGGPNSEIWVGMETHENDIYKVEVPDGYTSVIFGRMNPGTIENNWNNKWNQTSDLTIPTEANQVYTLSEGAWDSGEGSWSTIPGVPVQLNVVVVNGALASGITLPISGSSGENLSCTIVPNEGYQVLGSSVEFTEGPECEYLLMADGIQFKNVSGDMLVTITLIEQSEITVNFEGVHCSIYNTDSEPLTSVSITYGGTTPTFKIAAATGYQVKGLVITDESGKKYTPTPVSGDSFTVSNVTVTKLIVTCCLADGYYLVGDHTDWSNGYGTADKMETNPSNQDEYVIEKELPTPPTGSAVKIKVIHVVDGVIPEGGWINPSQVDSLLMNGALAQDEESNVVFAHDSTYNKYKIYVQPLASEGSKYYITQMHRVTFHGVNAVSSNPAKGVYLWADDKSYSTTITFKDKEYEPSKIEAKMNGEELDPALFEFVPEEFPTYLFSIDDVTGDLDIYAEQPTRYTMCVLFDETLGEVVAQQLKNERELKFSALLDKGHTYVFKYGGKDLRLMNMYTGAAGENRDDLSCTAVRESADNSVAGEESFNGNFTIKWANFTVSETLDVDMYLGFVEDDTKGRLWIEVKNTEKVNFKLEKPIVCNMTTLQGKIFGVTEQYVYKKSALSLHFVETSGYKVHGYNLLNNDVTTSHTPAGGAATISFIANGDIVITPEVEVTGLFKKIVLYDKESETQTSIPLYPKTDVTNISYAAEEKTLVQILEEVKSSLAALDKRLTDIESNIK